MQPSHYPGGGESSNAPDLITQTWHQNGKCPETTVPILRTKEEDVLRATSVNSYGKKSHGNFRPEAGGTDSHQVQNWILESPNISLLAHLCLGFNFWNCWLNIFFGSPIEQYAIASSPYANYYGTKVSVNLWKPKTERAQDFSLTQIWVSAGSYSNNDLNTIEVGWQVSSLIKG
jgi:hypothetical protein